MSEHGVGVEACASEARWSVPEREVAPAGLAFEAAEKDRSNHAGRGCAAPVPAARRGSLRSSPHTLRAHFSIPTIA